MRLLQLTPLLTAAIALCSCGGDESGDRGTTAPPPAECTVADVVLEDQSCLPPGVDVCAEGFVADGLGGCVAVLPPEPCPFGLMAVPGDEVCREVAPCGAAPWGDIPVEASTQYVDASYAGTSTGSADQPWTSLQEAIEAAAPGAIVALATGVYPANLDVTKPVRLWGRCPTEVALDATGGLRFATGATGSELRGMAVMGGAVFVSDATLLIEQAWLHDGGDFPIDLADEGAPAEVTVRDSLIELARTYAVTVSGSVATLERSEIRATQPNGAGLYGGGVQARVDPSTGVRATVTLQGCHLSLHTEAGLSLFGADAIVRGTAIRDIAGSQQLASGSAASLQTLGAHRSNL